MHYIHVFKIKLLNLSWLAIWSKVMVQARPWPSQEIGRQSLVFLDDCISKRCFLGSWVRGLFDLHLTFSTYLLLYPGERGLSILESEVALSWQGFWLILTLRMGSPCFYELVKLAHFVSLPPTDLLSSTTLSPLSVSNQNRLNAWSCRQVAKLSMPCRPLMLHFL